MINLLHYNGNIESDDIILNISEGNEEYMQTFDIEAIIDYEAVNAVENVGFEIEPQELEKITKQIIGHFHEGRTFILFEVYVDEGDIFAYLVKCPDIELSVFNLPHWDFSLDPIRNDFFRFIPEIQHHFIWYSLLYTKGQPYSILT